MAISLRRILLSPWNPKLPVIAGDPATVVKNAMTARFFVCNVVSHTHTATTSTVYMVTIPNNSLWYATTGGHSNKHHAYSCNKHFFFFKFSVWYYIPGLCTAVVEQQELRKINTFTLGFCCVPSIGRTCDLRYHILMQFILMSTTWCL